MSDSIQTRALRQEDLKWLACPVCRQSLALDAEFVRCNGCERRYPILNGIPILLEERAF